MTRLGGSVTAPRMTRHRLGTTDTGDAVIVEVRITTDEQDYTTVTHERVTGSLRLSVTGEVINAWHDRHGRGRDDNAIVSCGQVGGYADDPGRSALNSITTPAPGWTLAEIAELEAIWARWHLNDMRAACAHMDPATLAREPNGYGGDRISTTDPANTCPESGYRYGHAWLYEPIPADVLADVARLTRDRSHDLYAARGYDGAGKAYPPAVEGSATDAGVTR
jgi:hypothetical protein